jgi:hypothetical protein
LVEEIPEKKRPWTQLARAWRLPTARIKKGNSFGTAFMSEPFQMFGQIAIMKGCFKNIACQGLWKGVGAYLMHRSRIFKTQSGIRALKSGSLIDLPLERFLNTSSLPIRNMRAICLQVRQLRSPYSSIEQAYLCVRRNHRSPGSFFQDQRRLDTSCRVPNVNHGPRDRFVADEAIEREVGHRGEAADGGAGEFRPGGARIEVDGGN